MSEPNEPRIRVGITIGDVSGIGLEVIIKAFMDPAMVQECVPVIYGSSKAFSFHRKALGINEFNYSTIRNIGEVNPRKVNLINVWDDEMRIEFGKPSAETGRYALRSMEAACQDLRDKKIDVLVTAPVDKHAVNLEAPDFTGHTGYLAKAFNTPDPLMILVSEGLRVSVVTGHVPLRQVAALLSAEKVGNSLSRLHESLQRDFGIRKPRIAVLGLNPHAGDGGVIGGEEEEIIAPAIKKAVDGGMLAFGPYPADGLFGSGNYRRFDGILAMYHDQGLVPFKALSLGAGVNFTAGLPIVRTSPGHGTAADIAGKNEASADAFRQSVFMACDIWKQRNDFEEVNANPLAFSSHGRDR